MKKLLILLVAATVSMASFAQTSSGKGKQQKHKAAAQYSCPMHPGMVMSKPGKCSECGMDLVLSKKEKMKMEVMKTYSCSMHPDVVSDKPGKCDKCGMDLTEVKTKAKGKKG